MDLDVLTYNFILFSTLFPLILCSNSFNCSHSLSRDALSILEEIVYPKFEYSGLAFKDSCKLDPKKNLYKNFESTSKSKLNDRGWECRLCGKEFYTEAFIDQHLMRKHSDQLYTNDDHSCFADFCPILRCDVWFPDKIMMLRGKNWNKALCKANDFALLKKECENYIDECSDPGGFRKWLYSSVCDHLTCDNFWTRPQHLLPYETKIYFSYVLLGFLLLASFYLVMCIRLNRLDEHSLLSNSMFTISKLSAPNDCEYCSSKNSNKPVSKPVPRRRKT